MEVFDLKTYAIILNFNSAEETIGLYNNLITVRDPNLRILIIDNASKPFDQNQLKKNIPAPNIIINTKNIGYAGGNNIGINVALNDKADYVWILNPDTRVNDQTLPILLKTINEDKTLAAVGPRIIHRMNSKKIFSDGELIIMDEKCSTKHKNHNKEVSKVPKKIDYNVDYIAGSSILINCNAIKEVGKFPEEYFLYFEETDWCFRASQKNWKLAVNTYAEVYNLTSKKGEVFNYYFMRNRFLFSKKYHPNLQKVRSYYIKELLKEVVYRLKGKKINPFLKERVYGLISGIILTSVKK